jgi:hypothetical protein
MMLSLAPIAALGALGALRRRTFVLWMLAAAAITFGAGFYDGFVAGDLRWSPFWPRVGLFIAAALFILHHLIGPADAERRLRASYELYFDDGWKDAVRLGLAALFLGAFWLLLWLGATLFQLIGLNFLSRLIQQAWFAFPASTTVFAAAVHLTDVRSAMVRGARTLLLNLLAWLSPLIVLIAVGFLLALPFTGLKPLTEKGSATGVMLSACATLIVLANAAYQDGQRRLPVTAILRWSVRIAGVALAPMVLIAAYGISLRIQQHGLSPARIYACACLLVACCYAAGYLWAAVSGGPWMRRLEGVNWLTAHVIVLTILLVFSPLADARRVAVADQMTRLSRGGVAPQEFDYGLLHFKTGRWGREALKSLAAGEVRGVPQAAVELAQQEQRRATYWSEPTRATAPVVLAFRPLGDQPLPASFLAQRWEARDGLPFTCRSERSACPAFVAALDGEPGVDVVVLSGGNPMVYGLQSGRWARIGSLIGGPCGPDNPALAEGRFRLVPARPRQEVEVGDRRLAFVPERGCQAEAPVPAKASSSAGK